MENNKVDFEGAVCALPLAHNEKIVIGHGSGGKMTHTLIKDVFLKAFNNPILEKGNDAATIPLEEVSLVVSTDSHVVYPIFFPGGDIGKLAVCGTVNDVSMLGATPLYLTAAFILEEGFAIESLNIIASSMKTASEEAGVRIIAGDTKVVEKGKADGIFISTTGIGFRPIDLHIGGEMAQPGDAVIISGYIGDHGIAILEARGELGFTSTVKSDLAPLNNLISSLLKVTGVKENCPIHVLRDPTRGGLATSLNEIAIQSNVGILLEENSIPIRPEVQSSCEMLGFDPLFIANEGKVIVIVKNEYCDDIIVAMRSNSYGIDASVIGQVVDNPKQRVLMKTQYGSTRIIDMLSGEMLPRIC
jgi:hydrogenase expression/formation protein HypE